MEIILPEGTWTVPMSRKNFHLRGCLHDWSGRGSTWSSMTCGVICSIFRGGTTILVIKESECITTRIKSLSLRFSVASCNAAPNIWESSPSTSRTLFFFSDKVRIQFHDIMTIYCLVFFGKFFHLLFERYKKFLMCYPTTLMHFLVKSEKFVIVVKSMTTFITGLSYHVLPHLWIFLLLGPGVYAI